MDTLQTQLHIRSHQTYQIRLFSWNSSWWN